MIEAKPIILILGPTAGGKTALAIELARRLSSLPGAGGAECVCADSMQVYRGMDIGTAKPTAAERAAVPHHLLDLVDPSEDGFSVDTWLGLAERAIDEIRRRGSNFRGRYPIVVGGTSLYVQALLAGLFEGPEPDPALRARLQETPTAQLRRRLEEVDPRAAERIHRSDRKRTVRAIEVFELTGRPISSMQTQWPAGSSRRDVRIIGLDYPVEAINARINARVKSMIEAGLVDEVRRLHEAGALGRQAGEALGYKQIIEHLEGRCGLDEAVEQIKIRTRRLAKQQRTWLRRFRSHPGSVWLEADRLQPQAIVDKALRAIVPEFAPSGEVNEPPPIRRSTRR